MRLATLENGTRDGELAVVHRDGLRFASAQSIAPNLQRALDDWGSSEPRLRVLDAEVQAERVQLFPLDFAKVKAPLPRASEWVDGSAYINHIILVRKARNAEPPKTLRTDPLVYQGGSSDMLGARANIELVNPEWGLDFEAEIGVILTDTPIGTSAEKAHEFIKLVVILNDVTLRNLVPAELEKGFGFFTSKPATAFAPFAVTPDELGEAWQGGRLHRRLRSTLNGSLVGDPEAGPEMFFSFNELIAHITKTRRFGAGTILGSGTVSNEDRERGISCLAERRMIETIEQGKPSTPFMKEGDRISIEMLDDQGKSIFGIIDQVVARAGG